MFKARIVTPDGLYGEIDGITLMNFVSTEGHMGLLSNHMPLVTMLEISKLEIVRDKERNQYAIGGGMLYFENNLATLLVDSAEKKEEIDVERAMDAKTRAEQHLKDKNMDEKRAMIALRKAINRINVAGK